MRRISIASLGAASCSLLAATLITLTPTAARADDTSCGNGNTVCTSECQSVQICDKSDPPKCSTVFICNSKAAE